MSNMEWSPERLREVAGVLDDLPTKALTDRYAADALRAFARRLEEHERTYCACCGSDDFYIEPADALDAGRGDDA